MKGSLQRPRPTDHGWCEDPRSETDFAFYCPRQDWRYAIRDTDLWIYCPGCGADVAEAAAQNEPAWRIAP